MVCSLKNNRSAISLVRSPSANKCKTFNSAGETGEFNS